MLDDTVESHSQAGPILAGMIPQVRNLLVASVSTFQKAGFTSRSRKRFRSGHALCSMSKN